MIIRKTMILVCSHATCTGTKSITSGARIAVMKKTIATLVSGAGAEARGINFPHRKILLQGKEQPMVNRLISVHENSHARFDFFDAVTKRNRCKRTFNVLDFTPGDNMTISIYHDGRSAS